MYTKVDDDYPDNMPDYKNLTVLTPQFMTDWELHQPPLPSVLILKQPVTCST